MEEGDAERWGKFLQSALVDLVIRPERAEGWHQPFEGAPSLAVGSEEVTVLDAGPGAPLRPRVRFWVMVRARPSSIHHASITIHITHHAPAARARA